MSGAPVVSAVDYHTGGEPFRIVTGGVPPLEGTTILERRRFARDQLDRFRRLLVHEPRGHADMRSLRTSATNATPAHSRSSEKSR